MYFNEGGKFNKSDSSDKKPSVEPKEIFMLN